jgi:hypothetical protein
MGLGSASARAKMTDIETRPDRAETTETVSNGKLDEPQHLESPLTDGTPPPGDESPGTDNTLAESSPGVSADGAADGHVSVEGDAETVVIAPENASPTVSDEVLLEQSGDVGEETQGQENSPEPSISVEQ